MVLRIHSLVPVPIFYDSSNHLHRNLQYHPEQPERIKVCVDALKTFDSKLINLVDLSPSGIFQCQPCSPEELMHARDMLVAAHTEELVSNLEKRCSASRQRRVEEGRDPLGFVGYIDDDTYVTTETFDVCLRATAAWIRAVDAAQDNLAAFALTRPPGHHATKLLQNGFCLFNFAAAATLHAFHKSEDYKVSIVDWDVHYGQGVADIVQHHPRARYVSVHQTPAFPYEGEKQEIRGVHKNVLTLPVPPSSTWNNGYEHVMTHVALPFACTKGTWEPDLVIVCSGYDALNSDELASVSLEARDFGRMTQLLRQHLAINSSKPPMLVLGLEGGYQLRPDVQGGNLGDAFLETVKELVES